MGARLYENSHKNFVKKIITTAWSVRDPWKILDTSGGSKYFFLNGPVLKYEEGVGGQVPPTLFHELSLLLTLTKPIKSKHAYRLQNYPKHIHLKNTFHHVWSKHAI